ncbi:MAG TPA: hypothetical protein VFW64_17460 [Pseudonocardiaceae bacterium]|nr:hypothetical protein [Pseudonocardiaceae bacterium]
MFDLAGLLDLSGQYAATELAINPTDWVADRSLADLALRDKGVVVLGLHRADRLYLGAPTGCTEVGAMSSSCTDSESYCTSSMTVPPDRPATWHTTPRWHVNSAWNATNTTTMTPECCAVDSLR